jgi:hypothetical protein
MWIPRRTWLGRKSGCGDPLPLGYFACKVFYRLGLDSKVSGAEASGDVFPDSIVAIWGGDRFGGIATEWIGLMRALLPGGLQEEADSGRE